MPKHHSRLPIILILITLLSVAGWAVAGADSRVSAAVCGGSRVGVGANTTFSGEPDMPGIHDGGSKAIGGSSTRGIAGDAHVLLDGGIWIRLFQVRLMGR